MARRFILETGFDMGKHDNARKVLRLVKRSRPRRAWCSCPCGQWSAIQNLNQRTPAAKRLLKRKRRASRKLVGNCVQVLREVAVQGGDIYYEWPKLCQGWSIPELVRFRQDMIRLSLKS